MACSAINVRHRRLAYHNSELPVVPCSYSYEDPLRGSVSVDPAIITDHTEVSMNVGGGVLTISGLYWVPTSWGGYWEMT